MTRKGRGGTITGLLHNGGCNKKPVRMSLWRPQPEDEERDGGGTTRIQGKGEKGEQGVGESSAWGNGQEESVAQGRVRERKKKGGGRGGTKKGETIVSTGWGAKNASGKPKEKPNQTWGTGERKKERTSRAREAKEPGEKEKMQCWDAEKLGMKRRKAKTEGCFSGEGSGRAEKRIPK